jgi:tetratricopeptide (TPR) repeat protein
MDERLQQAELDALWRYDDPIASAERFAIAAAEPDRPELVRAELETQRSRAFGLQGRFAEAEGLLDSLEPAIGTLAIRILLERGRLRNTSGRADEAVPLLEEALLAARRDGDAFLAADAAHMLAIADPSRGEQWTEEGLAELLSSTDPRTQRWGVALHNNRGWALFDAGDAHAAVGEFEAALEAADRYGTSDQQFAAQWSLARALREVGRWQEALAIQTRLAAERPGDTDVRDELVALAAVEENARDAAHNAARDPATEAAPTIEP